MWEGILAGTGRGEGWRASFFLLNLNQGIAEGEVKSPITIDVTILKRCGQSAYSIDPLKLTIIAC